MQIVPRGLFFFFRAKAHIHFGKYILFDKYICILQRLVQKTHALYTTHEAKPCKRVGAGEFFFYLLYVYV